MIFTANTISSRMWSRIRRAQRKIQSLMVKKADELALTLLNIDMMVVVKEREQVAIANVLPDIRPIAGQLHDYALLYLNLPVAQFAAGFYRLQLAYGVQGALLPQGVIVDEQGRFQRNVRYYALDVFAPLAGAKTQPEKRLTIFETFNTTGNSYVLGGTHADGQAFVIVLDI